MQRTAFKCYFMKYYYPEFLVWAVSCWVLCICYPSRSKSFLLYKGKCFSCENTLDLIAVYELEELLSGRCFVCCHSLQALLSSSHVGSAYPGEPLHLAGRESRAKAGTSTVCPGLGSHLPHVWGLGTWHCCQQVLLCFCGVVTSFWSSVAIISQINISSGLSVCLTA